MADGQHTPSGFDYNAWKRSQRRKRIAAGLCPSCAGRLDVPGKCSCSRCLAKMSERGAAARRVKQAERAARLAENPPPPKATADMRAYKRAWRAARKASGVCTTCGGMRDTPGGVRCAACLTADKAAYHRRSPEAKKRVGASSLTRQRERAAAGLCRSCGAARDVPGRKRCAACAARSSELHRARRARWRAAGLCGGCGGTLTNGNFECDDCSERSRKEYRKSAAADPVKHRAKSARRRLALGAAKGDYTAADWLAVRQAQDFTCLMCGRREPEIMLTADHVLPLALGGSNRADNLQGLCASDNKSKRDRHIDLRHLAKYPEKYPRREEPI